MRQSLSMIALLVGCGIAFAGSPTVPPVVPRSLDIPEGSLVAPGKPPELDLLYTGDVIGYLEDCGCKMNPAGGLARRAWLLNQLKTNYPKTPFVLLDAGNFSDNPTEAGDVRTAALLSEMDKMGYRAVSVGDRDLAMGFDAFVEKTRGLSMDFISTNIVKQGTKTPVFAPYSLFEVKGTSGKPVRIGVLGIMRYSPVWQKAGPSGENLATAMPADMIKTYLPELRSKADVVVLLASIAKEDAHDLAKELPDIDLIVGAYGGIYNTVEENEGRVRIVYTGNQGKRIGESRVTFDAKRHVADMVTYMHFLSARYPDDKAMAETVAAVKAKLPKPAESPAPAQGGH
jgi:2',3'-cyclic-nucleotide 2'-phosphodiesterase (5'-nucleotidase family)